MKTLIAILPLVGCTVSRAVAPLPKGTGAIIGSIGGPITADLSPAIPVPLSSIGYMHGLNGKTNLHGEVYPTSLLSFGVFGMGLGAGTELIAAEGARPRLMIDGTLYGYGGNAASGDPPGALRFFPDLQTVLTWDVGNHHLYTGVDQLIQPFPSFRYHPTPLVGAQLDVGRVGFQAEYKWMAWYLDNRPLAGEWVGPVHHGASSIQLGMSIAIGKEEG